MWHTDPGKSFWLRCKNRCHGSLRHTSLGLGKSFLPAMCGVCWLAMRRACPTWCLLALPRVSVGRQMIRSLKFRSRSALAQEAGTTCTKWTKHINHSRTFFPQSVLSVFSFFLIDCLNAQTECRFGDFSSWVSWVWFVELEKTIFFRVFDSTWWFLFFFLQAWQARLCLKHFLQIHAIKCLSKKGTGGRGVTRRCQWRLSDLGQVSHVRSPSQ